MALPQLPRHNSSLPREDRKGLAQRPTPPTIHLLINDGFFFVNVKTDFASLFPLTVPVFSRRLHGVAKKFCYLNSVLSARDIIPSWLWTQGCGKKGREKIANKRNSNYNFFPHYYFQH